MEKSAKFPSCRSVTDLSRAVVLVWCLRAPILLRCRSPQRKKKTRALSGSLSGVTGNENGRSNQTDGSVEVGTCPLQGWCSQYCRVELNGSFTVELDYVLELVEEPFTSGPRGRLIKLRHCSQGKLKQIKSLKLFAFCDASLCAGLSGVQK